MKLIENAALKNLNPGAARALLHHLESLKQQMQAKKLNDIQKNCLRQQLDEKIADMKLEMEIDSLKKRKTDYDAAALKRKNHYSNYLT
jgi:hypothetical protein